jgi:hypothetical protein
MNERNHQTFALLEAANPVAADDLHRELGHAELDAARERLDRKLNAAGELAAPPRPGRPATRSSGSRSLRMAGAAGICLALGAVAFATLPEGGGRLSPLDAAAAVAASQSPPAATAGTYAYLRVRQGGRVKPRSPGWGPDSMSTTEFWIAADGSGRITKTTSAVDGETPGGDGWKRTGETWTRDLRFGAGRFPEVYRSVDSTVLDLSVEALPTETEALTALLRRKLAKAANDADPETGFRDPRASSREMLTVIGQILAHPLAPPQLRSALYEAAGTLDEVEVEEHAHDPSGRRATVIRVDETEAGTPMRYELFFDPQTSATLATRYTTSETFTRGGVIRLPDPAADLDRTERLHWRPSGCGTPERPCRAKAMKGIAVPRDGHSVRTTFIDFTVYEHGSVDSIHARP